MLMNVAAYSLKLASWPSVPRTVRLSLQRYQHWTRRNVLCSGRLQVAQINFKHQPPFTTAEGKESCSGSSPLGISHCNTRPSLHRSYVSNINDECDSVLQTKKRLLQEKREGLVRDIRERKEKVRERVEEVIERENVATIPNLLCIGRIVASPYLGYVIVQTEFRLAMALLIVAGLTDLADGWIARNWPNQASRLGSFLDPMADKVLVGSLVIAMCYIDLLPLWLTAMIVFRDVFLIGAGFVIRYVSLPKPRTLSRYFDVTHATAQLAPTFISKLNTAVQLVTVATTLGAPIFGYLDHAFLHGLWYLTGFTTMAAAVSYLTSKDTYKILRKKP
ncbi:probable cardiolipin synthase (CMP-forming) [Anopheles aquasalis]|uniref:probable cardiolipin synthase (CMP-forming) n=1 Tax=Anopheles aquasalis TaxID=42839 RepID=UPI00215AA1B5|nr:probable cardiolipin synthase (CMP-forming) [Anopheles aquasalis]XP_050087488.1 probable cardiolipin synthase (CMP-forming) [Anopheles aquasalis]